MSELQLPEALTIHLLDELGLEHAFTVKSTANDKNVARTTQGTILRFIDWLWHRCLGMGPAIN